MQIVIQTRFSYLGKSGWRSDASRDDGLLFAPDRLRRRFELFEKIMLPSLQHQSDPDFHLVILSSRAMPRRFRRRLSDTAADALGPARVTVKFAHPGHAARKLQVAVDKDFGRAGRLAEVVLDDDDALASTYVQVLRENAGPAVLGQDGAPGFSYFSFPRGLSLFGQDGRLRFAGRNIPFTNLGLALVRDGAVRRNVFAVSHKKIGSRHPHVLVDPGEPFYLRTVHTDNDSRSILGDDILDLEASDPALLDRFPLLAGLDPAILNPRPVQASS